MRFFDNGLRLRIVRGLAAITAGILFTSVSLAPYTIGKLDATSELAALQCSAAGMGNVLQNMERNQYFQAIKTYSSEFGVDYRLVLAVIKQESQFVHESVSEKGAAGLMQIMPATSSDLSDILDLDDITLPHENLRAGIYYLSSMMDLFKNSADNDRIELALAAYNAGPARVYDAQELAAYMGENPNSWSSIRSALPLLSKRYYSLHASIWPEGRPRNGNFGSWRQTVNYVDRIMSTYRNYSRIFG